MHTSSKPKGFKRLIVGCSLITMCLSSSLDAQPVVHLTGENEQFVVTVEEIPDLSKTPVAREINREVSIRIQNKKDGRLKEFVHRESLHKINELAFCIADKAVLIGQLAHGGDSVTILDVKKGEVQDVIRAYGYSISPSKQFLVYKSWYPRLGPARLRKSIVLIYNLANSASSNRTPCINEYSYRNAGFPIFPEANAYFVASDPNCLDGASNLKPYDVNLDGEYYVTSPFLWSDNRKELVFFAYNRNEQRNYLVRIDLNSGMDKVTIFRKPVNMADLVKWDVISDVTKKELTEKPYRLGVKSLDWSDKNKIVVEPYQQYWLDKKLEMLLP